MILIYIGVTMMIIGVVKLIKDVEYLNKKK